MIDQFAEKYYTDDDGYVSDYYIIWEVYACFNDEEHRYINDIFTALHNNIPKEVVHERYDYKDQLNHDSNGEKNPTNLISFRQWAPKIEMTEEEKEKAKQEMVEIVKILDEECEKNKSEEYKAKEDQRKKDSINVWNEHEWDMYCTVYTAKQAIKQYHIERWEFF